MKKRKILQTVLVFVPTLGIPLYCSFSPQAEEKYCSYVRPFTEPSAEEKVLPIQNDITNGRIAASMTLSGTVSSSVSPYIVYPGTTNL